MGETKKALITKNKTKKTYIIIVAIIIAIIVIDQITKVIVSNIGNIGNIEIIPGILQLNITQNKTGAYGIGTDSTIMYIITNLIVIAVLLKFLTGQNELINTRIKIFISLIIAGGISNVIDRIIRGYVLEYIQFNIEQIPAFNIADISVLIGWIAFVAIFTNFTIKEIRQNKEKKEIKFEDNNKEKKSEKNNNKRGNK